jgi:hypothetical protein
MPIREEKSTEQEEEIIKDETIVTPKTNVSPIISLIPASSTKEERTSLTQEERFLQVQPQELLNLTMPARRRRYPQNHLKDIKEVKDTNDINENDVSESSTSSVNSVIDTNTDKTDKTVTSTALVHKPHSEFALAVDKVTTASRAGLDLAGIITNLALEAAKISTKASLGIARTVTGVMSDRLVQTMSNDGTGRLVF